MRGVQANPLNPLWIRHWPHASETWPLTFWACRTMTGPWSKADLQYQTKKHNWCKIKRTTGVTSSQGHWPHLEREKASLVWTCGALKQCCKNCMWLEHLVQRGPKLAENDWPLKVEALSCQPPWKEHQEIWPRGYKTFFHPQLSRKQKFQLLINT